MVAFNAPHAPFHAPPSELYSGARVTDPPPRPQTRRAYLAALEALDTELGRLLASVDLSDTLVIFMADNGTPILATNSIIVDRRAKGTLFEGGVHVPMVVAGGNIQTARVEPRLVHAVDFFDTIAELFGLTIKPSAPPRDGHSFAAALCELPPSAGPAAANYTLLVEQFGNQVSSRDDVGTRTALFCQPNIKGSIALQQAALFAALASN